MSVKIQFQNNHSQNIIHILSGDENTSMLLSTNIAWIRFMVKTKYKLVKKDVSQ